MKTALKYKTYKFKIKAQVDMLICCLLDIKINPDSLSLHSCMIILTNSNNQKNIHLNPNRLISY